MRMWMVDPKIMCRQHLLGEHLEIHMFVNSINEGKRLTGFVTGNLLEVDSLSTRHALLVKEMTARGYRHKSPLPQFDTSLVEHRRIDRQRSKDDLLKRCTRCQTRRATVKGS